MHILNCAQHSEAWELARLGIPTSSEFSRILTPGGERSAQWKGYAYRLIAERLLQAPLEHYSSPAMERGQIVEEEAIAWYEFDTGEETTKVGFITDDTGIMGCSPDRLIGEDGLLEVKCPLPPAQVEYLITGRAQRHHKPQLQGQLMITEREWVDILCWHEIFPKVVVRVQRDEHFIALLGAEIRRVNEWIETEIDKIRTAGYVHVPQAKAALKDMLRASLGAVP
jgi:hypothetical protein